MLGGDDDSVALVTSCVSPQLSSRVVLVAGKARSNSLYGGELLLFTFTFDRSVSFLSVA